MRVLQENKVTWLEPGKKFPDIFFKLLVMDEGLRRQLLSESVVMNDRRHYSFGVIDLVTETEYEEDWMLSFHDGVRVTQWTEEIEGKNGKVTIGGVKVLSKSAADQADRIAKAVEASKAAAELAKRKDEVLTGLAKESMEKEDEPAVEQPKKRSKKVTSGEGN